MTTRSATPARTMPAARAGTADGTPWWRHAVIYEVYVRSFADHNGDGIGDLAGIRDRVPYLADLGVDALWLTPFYTSPMADGGYDVADYRDVDPTLGTLDDFDALIAEAHAYGLRLVVDIVPNHTSSAHPWFVEALAAAPGSPARARFHFHPGRGSDGQAPPNDWESVFGGPAWTRVADGDWYLHLFDPSQPDLNWENPQVHAEFADILRFWLDRGVDGFRIDVAHGMVKAEGLPDVGRDRQISLLGHEELPYFDREGVHEIYREWRRILDSYPGERAAVAEAWAPNPERLARYVRPDELHQAFNFFFLGTGWDAAALRTVIDESLAASEAVGAPSTWVLSNHDVRRHLTRYSVDPAGDGETGVRRARAAALLLLALPGSAYLYQGEELGLPEVLDLPEEVLTDPVWERSGHTDRGRDGCRVPLPWSGDAPPYGFSTGDAAPHGTWLPQPASWARLTVQHQSADPHSMLSLYRSALRARRDIGGELRWHSAPGDTVLVFSRDDVTVTVNVGDTPVEVTRPGDLVIASADAAEFEVAGGGVTLPPAAAAWWRTPVETAPVDGAGR